MGPFGGGLPKKLAVGEEHSAYFPIPLNRSVGTISFMSSSWTISIASRSRSESSNSQGEAELDEAYAGEPFVATLPAAPGVMPIRAIGTSNPQRSASKTHTKLPKKNIIKTTESKVKVGVPPGPPARSRGGPRCGSTANRQADGGRCAVRHSSRRRPRSRPPRASRRTGSRRPDRPPLVGEAPGGARVELHAGREAAAVEVVLAAGALVAQVGRRGSNASSRPDSRRPPVTVQLRRLGGPQAGELRRARRRRPPRRRCRRRPRAS